MQTTLVPYNKYDLLQDGDLYKNIWNSNPDMLKYSEEQLINMIMGCNKYIGDVVTRTRDGVSMPLHMGIMFSGTYGKGEHVVDHVTSKSIGKEVSYANHHSDGYGATVYYKTYATRKRFALGNFWGYEPTDEINKLLKKYYTANWKIYAHVPNGKRAWSLFTKAKLKEYAKEKGKEVQELYDEFDFDNID